ncbi:10819_t:CDS:2 [Gigaspora margarita]|uniref:10819_t:CDS:1 n=1 Tax=Gigaspora margarita TaxID=4874 RepID=A0ABM8W5X3_GIGMA|nr:10819_t:CDS:2 [Gigaspora margarita]
MAILATTALTKTNTHLNRKNLCRPQIIPTTNPNPIPQINLEANNDTKHQISDSSLDQVSDSSGPSNKVNLNTEYSALQTETEPQEIIISQKEYEFLKAQVLIEDEENENTMDLDEYLTQEEFEFFKTLDLIENDAVLDTGIHFIQIRVSDPERPHDNFNLLSKQITKKRE